MRGMMGEDGLEPRCDPLAAARGIAFASMLSSVLWVGLVISVWSLL